MRLIKRLIVNKLSEWGFLNIHRSQVHGPRDRLCLSEGVDRGNNALFNTRSGLIVIRKDTVIGFNCMFLTGSHQFGKDGKLPQPESEQIPKYGKDIRIGRGCVIGSGALFIGDSGCGNDCLVAAGAVVTKDFGDNVVLGGVPARVIGRTDEKKEPEF